MPDFDDNTTAQIKEMLGKVMKNAPPAPFQSSSMNIPLKELTIALAAIGMIWGRNTSDWSAANVKRRAFELGEALFDPLGQLDD